MNNSLLSAAPLLVQSIGWALLYTLWQGLIVAAALFVLLKLLKNAEARTRYHISMLLFTTLFAWFADTWYTGWQHLQKITVLVTESGADLGTGKTTSIITLPNTAGSGNIIHQLAPQLEKNMPLIVGIYIIGLLLMLSRFILNLLSIKALRKHGIVQPTEKMKSLFAQWKLQLNIARPVKFFLSDRINVPMMMGLIKPIILLPLASINQLSIDQLEAILLHELAHIKRHDYLLNIFQTIVETVLFFNPFIWWISSVIRREREHCCDDLVVANTSSSLPYVKALAVLEAQRNETADIALAATGNKNQLFNRIKRITEMKKHSINYAQVGTAIILIAVLVLSITWFTPGFAQKTGKRHAESDTTSISKTRIIIIDDDGNKKEYRSLDKMPKEEREKLRKELADEDHVNKKIIKKETIIKKSDGKTTKDEDISASIDDAMKSIDFDKIGKDLSDAMKEAGNALKEVDWTEVSKTLQTKLEEIKKEMPDAKEQKDSDVDPKNWHLSENAKK